MRRPAGAWFRAWGVGVGLAVSPGIVLAGSIEADDPLPTLQTPALYNNKNEVGAPRAPAHAAVDLNYWLGDSHSIGLGLDHARIQLNTSSKLAATPVMPPGPLGTRLIDPDSNLDALSFDLKVRWPGPTGAGLSSLQPFVSFGPALFVARPNDAVGLGLPGDRQSVSMSLGLIGGAGVSWRFGENAALFGEYRFMQSSASRLAPYGGGGPPGNASTPDLLYGIAVRF
jgi:hypothetical protein